MWPFHRHDWKLVGVEHAKRVHVWGAERVHGGDVTLVKYRCAGCPRVFSQDLEGTWTRAELTGEAS